ncbi:MAG: hypothetical protein IBJ12_09045 [Sphingomonadaceae bacterium]|nr:hypothetical protein [Sphingomonadaceae bacterium]
MRHISLLSFLLVLTACGGNDDSATVTTSEGDEVKITTDSDDNDSGTITFESKEGEGKIVFGDEAVKQGLPLGLPVYPGGDVRGAFMGSSSKDGAAGGMVTGVASAAPDKVIDFYKVEAEKRDMNIKTTTTANNTAAFSAEDGKGATLMVTATLGDDGKTTASIIGGSKK